MYLVPYCVSFFHLPDVICHPYDNTSVNWPDPRNSFIKSQHAATDWCTDITDGVASGSKAGIWKDGGHGGVVRKGKNFSK